MIVQCAWCKKVTGEKAPLEDKSVTHGCCEKCLSFITINSTYGKMAGGKVAA